MARNAPTSGLLPVAQLALAVTVLVSAAGCDQPSGGASATHARTDFVRQVVAAAPRPTEARRYAVATPLAYEQFAQRPHQRGRDRDRQQQGHIYEANGIRYLMFMTGGARSDERLPMVIDFHGANGHAEKYAQHIHLRDRARVIVPIGTLQTEKTGHPEKTGRSWFTPGLGHVGHEAQLTREMTPVIAHLSRAIATMTHQWPTAGKPTITGFSQGGEITYAMALSHPEQIGYACPVSGQAPAAFARKPPRGTVLPEVHGFHGGSDPAIDVRSARATIANMRRLGYRADLKEYRGRGHGDVHTVSAGDEMGCLSRGIRRSAGRS